MGFGSRSRRRKRNYASVNFANRGLSKVIKSKGDLSDETADKSTVLNISNALSGRRFRKGVPTGFMSIPEFFGVDYVGYIVDKERQNKASGQWIRTDEYRIVGAEASNFKDSRVAYGYIYRYRIKSIVKVTVKQLKQSFENLDSIKELKRFEKNRLKAQLRAKMGIISGVEKITNIGLRNKVSSGKKFTSFDLLSNFSIKATAEGMKSVKIPKFMYDKVNNLRRQKNLRVVDPDLMRGSISREALQKVINTNLRRLKEEAVEYISFYYESDPAKNWQYIVVQENVPPPSPSSIKITPSSVKQSICITWLKPANIQRDIKSFNLYRKNEIDQPWSRVATFPENWNYYIDKNVRFGYKYIYALTCIDVHGMESFLSMQIQAELNSSFIHEKKEKKLKWISGSGARPDEINVVFKKFLDQEKPIIAKKNIVISPTKEFNETIKYLLIKVTSLDTHEQREFKVNLVNLNIREIDA